MLQAQGHKGLGWDRARRFLQTSSLFLGALSQYISNVRNSNLALKKMFFSLGNPSIAG